MAFKELIKEWFSDVKDHFKNHNFNLKWKCKVLIPIFILLLAIDVLTKQFAFHYLDLYSDQDVNFIPGFIQLKLIFNSGVAFGSNQGNLAGNIIGAVFITIFAFLFAFYFTRKWLAIGFVFIFSGGFGNLIDRMWNHGKVVDFLHWVLFPPESIFNFADACVTIGCVVIILGIIIDWIYSYLHRNDEDIRHISKSNKES